MQKLRWKLYATQHKAGRHLARSLPSQNAPYVGTSSLPTGVNVGLDKDKSDWWSYHRIRGHHAKYYHQVKKEIKILIQRRRLLSYTMGVGEPLGKRSAPRRELNSENPSPKKGKNIEYVWETICSILSHEVSVAREKLARPEKDVSDQWCMFLTRCFQKQNKSQPLSFFTKRTRKEWWLMGMTLW